MTGSPSPMSRAEVDRAIGELGAAYDRVSTRMYVLDTRADVDGLRTAELTGETALVAAEALARIGVLWAQFGALAEGLRQAREVRARRPRPGNAELRELTRLFRTPLVRFDADGMVLDDSVAGPAERRVGLVELARRIEDGTGVLAGTLSALGTARDEVVGRFAQFTDTVRRLRSQIAALGADRLLADELDALGRRVEQTYAGALGDPLAASRNGSAVARIGQLAAELDALAERVAELTELRDQYPGRVARLGAELDELAVLGTETGRVYATVSTKIANPALPELPDGEAAFRSHLRQLDQLHREGRWSRLGVELGEVERAVAAARMRMAELHEAADGLLRRRAELRGRLDAYRAKAGRLGLVEHTELSARYRLARDLLYTVPCDLSAATRAVVGYQRHLNDLAERPTPGRREP